MMSTARVPFRLGSMAWHANQPFFGTIAVYFLASLFAAEHWNIPLDVKLYSKTFLLFGFGVSVILFAVISARVMVQRPPRLFPALKERLIAHELPDRLIIGLPVVFVLPTFFSLFTSMKRGINRIVPFYADPVLIAIDRTIHGGVDAWRILHPLFGYGPITFALNFVYSLWFVVMVIVLFCVTFSVRDERVRSQYLVAYVLTWALLGNVAASMCASVGPAFVVSFYNDATFGELINYLGVTNSVYPIWALDVQGALLANQGLEGPQLGGGISAFPSLHVAIATMNAIYLWRFGGFLRWAGVAFLAGIQLGAVHLAWHYAVDGYASMLATPIIWFIAGWLSRGRRHPAQSGL